jgi:hypothetical protein
MVSMVRREMPYVRLTTCQRTFFPFEARNVPSASRKKQLPTVSRVLRKSAIFKACRFDWLRRTSHMYGPNASSFNSNLF